MCISRVDILKDAINEGIAEGYTEGYLRKSVVAEPLFERKNTTNNTPAVIHTRIVPGDKLKIKVAPKGFGSENKSVLKMLVPADGIEGVKKSFRGCKIRWTKRLSSTNNRCWHRWYDG